MNEPSQCPYCSKIFNWGIDADSAIVKIESCRANAFWKMNDHITAEHPNEGFLCPRRDESMSGVMRGPQRDWWEKRHGYDTCSYCGSVSAAVIFEAIKNKNEITPTDKSYKIYLELPEPQPDKLRVVSECNHDPKDERYEKIETGDGPRWRLRMPNGPTYRAKHYFQHMSKDEQIEFVRLINEKAFNLSYPGHFYVLPYFVRK